MGKPGQPTAKAPLTTNNTCSYAIDDQLATLVLYNSPQNRIDARMSGEFAEALDAIDRGDAR
jgi:hypothetical protein